MTGTGEGYQKIKVAKTKDGRQAFAVTKGAVNNAPQTRPRKIAFATAPGVGTSQ